MSRILSCFGFGCGFGSKKNLVSDNQNHDEDTITDSENVCWICLCYKNDKKEDLFKPCKCVGDMYVHPDCLSKWQVHNIGKEEETNCRFCKEALPDWQNNYVLKTNRIIVLSLCTPSAVVQINIDPSKTPDFESEFRRILEEDYGICAQRTKITFTTRFNNAEIANDGLENMNKMLHLARYNAENRPRPMSS